MYLAEHHPDRVAGLAFMDMHLVMPGLENQEVKEHLEITSRAATDLGSDVWAILGSRHIYRPGFLSDGAARFGIPALWITSEIFGTRSIYEVQAGESSVQRRAEFAWKDKELKAYYQQLAADPEKRQRIHDHFAR